MSQNDTGVFLMLFFGTIGTVFGIGSNSLKKVFLSLPVAILGGFLMASGVANEIGILKKTINNTEYGIFVKFDKLEIRTEMDQPVIEGNSLNQVKKYQTVAVVQCKWNQSLGSCIESFENKEKEIAYQYQQSKLPIIVKL